MSSNSMFVLHPYQDQGRWVFDDERVGLVAEPFVFGIDAMIDRLVTEIPDAAAGFHLIFSVNSFPGSMVGLEWLREEAGGNWYYAREYEMEGWLCPALFKYFESAPASLYAKAERASR